MPFCGMTNPSDQKRGPVCGVTAVAIVAGVTFQKSWDVFTQIKHAADHRMTGVTDLWEIEGAMTKLNVNWKEILPKKGNALKGEVNWRYQKISLKEWIRLHAHKDIIYLIRTSGHIQTVLNGVVIDQDGLKPLSLYWGKRKEVSHVYEITP